VALYVHRTADMRKRTASIVFLKVMTEKNPSIIEHLFGACLEKGRMSSVSTGLGWSSPVTI